MSEVWTGEIDWQSIEARFKPPIELQQPSPRQVVPRDTTQTGCRASAERGCLAGCLLPIFLLGVLLVFWSGLAALLLPLGATTTGVITQRERGNGGQSTYALHFRFRVEGRNHVGQSQVNTASWKRTRVGDTARVRYFPFAPGLRPLLADASSPWTSIFGLGPLGLLMVGITALPLVALFTRRQGKRLVRSGLVTPAFITERDLSNRQLTFLIHTPQGHTIEITERPTDVSDYRVGQIEAALYPHNTPRKARLYRALDWKANSP